MRHRAGILAIALAVLTACGGTTDDRPAAGAGRNTLNWQTASEAGIFGYLIYRSESREGPFRRINDRIVRVPRDRQDTHDYSWIDDSVESGKTYYYYLDAVTVTGIKQRFSGIIDRTTP